jgi:hypothetical protein
MTEAIRDARRHMQQIEKRKDAVELNPIIVRLHAVITVAEAANVVGKNIEANHRWNLQTIREKLGADGVNLKARELSRPQKAQFARALNSGLQFACDSCGCANLLAVAVQRGQSCAWASWSAAFLIDISSVSVLSWCEDFLRVRTTY